MTTYDTIEGLQTIYDINPKTNVARELTRLEYTKKAIRRDNIIIVLRWCRLITILKDNIITGYIDIRARSRECANQWCTSDR